MYITIYFMLLHLSHAIINRLLAIFLVIKETVHEVGTDLLLRNIIVLAHYYIDDVCPLVTS